MNGGRKKGWSRKRGGANQGARTQRERERDGKGVGRKRESERVERALRLVGMNVPEVTYTMIRQVIVAQQVRQTENEVRLLYSKVTVSKARLP